MTRKEIYTLIVVGVLILAAAIVGGAYFHASILAAKESQIKADVQQQIATLQKDVATELAKIKADQKITEPAKIVQTLPQYITLPKPIYIQGPQTIPMTPDASGKLPDAPSASQGALIVPPESIQAFWQHETDCRADSLKLAECTKEVPLITKRAEAAEKAMKGGGFFSRLKNGFHHSLCGAAGGGTAVGIGLNTKNPGLAAGFGVGTFALCELVLK